MKIREIKSLLDARVYCGEENFEAEIKSACGSDMMSDVLAFVKDQGVLLTGLLNPQVVRTAEMLDMRCIVFTRGKEPTDEIVSLSSESGIAVMGTKYRMFEACGILYSAGLGTIAGN